MKKVVFITGTLSQPRVIKRIESIFNSGFQVKVYGFDRGVYNCNVLSSGITYINLGSMKDGGEYLSKLKRFKTCVGSIIEKEGREDVLYYSFSVLSAYFLKKQAVKYVYELSDLLYGYPKFNLVRPICKALDKQIIRSSALTVMTSEGFRDYLFGKKFPRNIIIQPNKLNAYFDGRLRPDPLEPDINHLRFAFIGAIRYKETVLRFAEIVGQYYPYHQFDFYGDSSCAKEFQKATSKFKNVRYHGAFKNPDDLDVIYSNVDIVVACYETESLNERIAEPNKLYEAAYFCKPIVVSDNSFLQKQVARNHCGYAIDAYDDQKIKEFISSLSLDSISRIQMKENAILKDTLIDNPSAIINYISQIR